MESSTNTTPRFQVSPMDGDVFDFKQFQPMSNTNLSLNNPVYLPSNGSIILDSPILQPILASQSQKSQYLCNRQGRLFDRQISEFVHESQKPPPKYDNWDKATTSPENDQDKMHSDRSIQWLKILVYNITFAVILVFGIASKCLTLLMTSMIHANRSIPICSSNNTRTLIDPPLNVSNSYSVIYEAPSVHRIAWLWCLYFATITPYLLAFGRSVRICYFKKFSIPKISTTIIVS